MSQEGPGWLSRALAWPLEILVLGYQRLFSPLFAQSCRYYPSCSGYALTALRRFGPLVGTWLAARRLTRCHPWCAGGVDHVPPRGAHGLPGWPAHRAEAARREAAWADDLGGIDGSAQAPSGNPGVPTGVRQDDDDTRGRRAAAPENAMRTPARRGMP